MVRNIFVSIVLTAFLASANNEKSTPAPSPSKSEESTYIQLDLKKSKKYEIYTEEGVFIEEGIVDFNSRVNVSNLKSGIYLLVVGKKALRFTVK